MTLAKSRANELLDVLEEHILREGFHKLTVSDMASLLRCSRRTLYELAASRDALILLVLDRLFTAIRDDAAEAVASTADVKEKIYLYLRAGAIASRRGSPIFVSDVADWEPGRAVWREHVRLRATGLEALVHEGIEQGVFRPVHAYLVSELVIAMARRLRDPEFYVHTDIDLGKAFSEFYSILLHGIVRSETAELSRWHRDHERFRGKEGGEDRPNLH